MSPVDNGGALAAAVSRTTDRLHDAGLRVLSSRPIAYGQQMTVSDGSASLTVNVYGGKKGISIVVGGSPGSTIWARVSAIATGTAAASAKAIGAGNAPASMKARRFPPQPATDRQATIDRFPAGPWIGSDESGKGDYFGPLVAAAVYVHPNQEPALRAAGVRDSKLLDDATAHRVAATVRRLCEGRFAEEVCVPSEYNALYARFKTDKQNLNHLLAWGHAHVLGRLLADPSLVDGGTLTVIADQFADERYVRERLQQTVLQRGVAMPALVQAPRAEANVAVASASILARDRFLCWLNEASTRYGIRLPKGGSNPAIVAAARQIVAKFGEAELANVAKLHFATSSKVTSRK